MLQEDPRRTYLPDEPERIAALYEGTNQPLVQPVGRALQAAQAVVVALHSNRGYEPIVALTLAETRENVLYTGPAVAEEDLAQALADPTSLLWVRGRVHTEMGKLADLAGNRKAARAEYQTAVDLGRRSRDDTGVDEARRLLDVPYKQ